MRNGHKAAACLYAPTLVTGGSRALGKVLFLDCQLEWNVPEEAPKTCLPLLLPSLPYTLDASQFLQHHSVEGAFIIGGVTLRREAGGGNPITWKPGTQGAFQSSSSPEAPYPLGAVDVVSLQEDPPGSGGCGPV